MFHSPITFSLCSLSWLLNLTSLLSKEKVHKSKKIYKFIILLYPVQLRGVLILRLFSRSRKENGVISH